MEQEQPQQIKTISTVVVILLALGAGYVLFAKYRPFLSQANLPTSESTNDQSATVMVKNTPMVNGTILAPRGFPPDIPLESSNLTESATTEFPGENVRQLSVSYQSSKTVAEKYAEYRNYMTASGYQITEGDTSSPIRTILGTKESANLSVIISRAEGRTLVQLSYLLKSVQ